MGRATRSSLPPSDSSPQALGWGSCGGAQEGGILGVSGTHSFLHSRLGCSLGNEAQNPRGDWVGGKQVPGQSLLDGSSILDLLCLPVPCSVPCLGIRWGWGGGRVPKAKLSHLYPHLTGSSFKGEGDGGCDPG